MTGPAWSASDVDAAPVAEHHPHLGVRIRVGRVASAAICAACPVRLICLEYAMDHNEPFGIWGGLSRKQRERLAAARKKAAAAGRAQVAA